MLINLRNALMAGKRLPYDAEVEYLESTGTQYIDTGVKKTSGTTIDCTFSLAATNTKAVFGARTGAANSDRLALFAFNSNFRFDAGDQKYLYTPDTTSKFRFQYDGTNAVLTNLTTGVVDTQALSIGEAGTVNIVLFGVSTNGEISAKLEGRIYSFKLWQSGVLVLDLIPVRKGTVGYLYDRVSGKLFGNAGTGDFVVGQDVVPVEYIESTGTQWIDTGFKTTSDSTIEISAAVSNFVVGDIIFGSKGTDATTLIRLLEYIRNGVSILALQSGAFGVTAGGYITADTNFHKYLITPSGASIDDSIGYQKSRTSNTETNFLLFTYVSATDPNKRLYSQSKIAYAKILQGTTLVRSFRPIRVGTDATSWEGAMIDTLTRRIYRNAGSGAFAYGNDLKYPIPAE